MEKYTLKAEKRDTLGRKVKKLRSQGILPANVFGKKVKSLSVQTDYSDFEKMYKEAGETGLIDLQIGKEKRPVLVHEVQTDPVTDSIIHADFLQVDLKQKVIASVPVEMVGESPAEKQNLGTIVQYIDEVEVEALPTELPEKFEVDISKLSEVDEAVYIKDLPVDKKKVEVKADPEEIVIKVEPQRKEEEAPPVEEVAPEGEEEEHVPEGEAKPEEGEEVKE